MDLEPASGAISFDLFETLVEVASPPEPASAVATELRKRGISVPAGWDDAYTEVHVDVPVGVEVPLTEHVRAALESRSGDDRFGDDENAIHQAVLAAFDPDVETHTGATEAVETAAEHGPVGVLSNCSVPGLVDRALSRSKLDHSAFDGIVTSVECGWRKPDRRAFETIAAELDVDRSRLVHVGDDPRTDGAAADAGASAILVDDVPLHRIPSLLEANAWPP